MRHYLSPIWSVVIALSCAGCSGGGGGSEQVVAISAVNLTAGVWVVDGRQPSIGLDWSGSTLRFTEQTPNGSGWDLVGVWAFQISWPNGGVVSATEAVRGVLDNDRRIVLEAMPSGISNIVVGNTNTGVCPGRFFADLSDSGLRMRRGTWIATGNPVGPSGPISGSCPPGEWTAELIVGTTPPDTDGDGIADDVELQLGTDPSNPDSDGDQLSDGEELVHGTDPLAFDTDGDGLGDGFEIDVGSNALAADPVSWIQGTVLLPDGSPAPNCNVRLRSDSLANSYPGLSVTTDQSGMFAFGMPWPSGGMGGPTAVAECEQQGVFYYAAVAVQNLSTGNYVLPALMLELQPYTRGRDFFAMVPYVSGNRAVVAAVMNPSAQSASVSWVVPSVNSSVAGNSGTITLEPWGATSFALPGAALGVASSTIQNHVEQGSGGVRITSDLPISVAIQAADGGNNSGMVAFSCLPRNRNGTRYYPQTFWSTGFNASFGAYVLAMASAGDATLDLQLSVPVTLDLNGSQTFLPVGVASSFTLLLERSLQFVAEPTFNGSLLSSNASFGVLSGTTKLSQFVLGGLTGGGDAIETLAPTNQWGTEFVTFGGVGGVDGCIHIQAGDEAAEVSVGGNLFASLLPGQDAVYPLVGNTPTTVQSDAPILAWQLFGGYNLDSAAVHLAPPSRWTRDEVLWSFTDAGMDPAVAILLHRSAIEDTRLDGVLVRNHTGMSELIVDNEYAVVVFPVIAGAHRITSSEPVFPMAFGFGGDRANGYAYSPTW